MNKSFCKHWDENSYNVQGKKKKGKLYITRYQNLADKSEYTLYHKDDKHFSDKIQ
jgi:hypothetical protein